MDPAVISYINTLHQQFMASHAKVHDDFVVSHEREHTLEDAATAQALLLAAEHLKWEMVAIREVYGSILKERDDRYTERASAHELATRTAFTATEHATATAFAASEEATKLALDAQEKTVAAAFEASEKAIVKAEISIEKRADATYVSLNELTRSLGNLLPRAEADVRILNVEERVASLSSRLDRQEAAKVGVSEAKTDNRAVIGTVIGAVLFVIALIGFFNARANMTTPTAPPTPACSVAAPGQACVTNK